MSINNKFLDILIQCGAILNDDHFVYASKRHGESYINKRALYPYPKATSAIGHGLAKAFFDEGIRVDAVLAPAVGGIPLVQWTAFHLSVLQGSDVLALFAEKIPTIEIIGGQEPRIVTHFEMTSGYGEMLEGKRTLALEDILTTGDSIKDVVQLGRKHFAEIVGVSAMCNRGGVTAEKIGVPLLRSLLDFPLQSWTSEECPRCQADFPVNLQFGKGKEFVASLAA